jgi:uncharacterized glyoxalase superfamily protein PhnB
MLSAGLWDKSFQRHRAVAAWLKGLSPMKFASTRLVATDIKAMVGFYELVTGQRAEWLAPVFAEIVTPSATLAIGSVETVALFKEGSAEPGANRTAIIEFQVNDVDSEFARLKDAVEVVHEPKMMPWGNRAAQFRDPEGTLVGMYTPVTEAAKARFGSR